MKKAISFKLFFFISFLLVSLVTNGQNIPQKLKLFLLNQEQFSDLQPENWIISSEHFDRNRSLQYYYVQQTYRGIPLFNALATIVEKNDGFILTGDRIVHFQENSSISIEPSITPEDAIQSVIEHLELPNAPIQFNRQENNKYVYNSEISSEEIPVELMFFPKDERLYLIWNLNIAPTKGDHWWSIRVDANTGEIIDQSDWVTNCIHPQHSPAKAVPTNLQSETTQSSSLMAPPPGTDQYNVFELPIESPNHGSRSIVVGPSNPTASPYGWHDDNGISGEEYTITRGNNVYAYEDSNDDNQPGYSPDGGSTLNFDFPLNLNQPSQNYYDAAITNLFYMNNMMHDIWYHYGFDEASGNFQENNYGNGGISGDYVYAEAQDGGGTNNANFATPPDGSNPRMQMYLWNAASNNDLLTVNTPSSIAGSYTAVEAAFGPPVPTTPITSDIVIYNDGVPDEYDACEAPINGALFNNKIVLIRRGSCTFVSKVEYAQNYGAAAVIVVNNVASAPITMGGTSTTINIPSVMISQADGNAIIDIIENNGTVNATLQNSGPFEIDGDFDNGIIAHEYGHGISNRLTGGANTTDCLNNNEQMGEGWSDFFALMLTIEPGDSGPDARGIGTFAINEPITGDGIRPAPYSTDFSVNNYTYGATNNNGSISQPHGIGFIWCTMLWDLNWALIDQYGFDPDLYNGTGGNNMAMNLVMTALKLQPCSPGFVDGRDAILQADQLLYNGQNQCLIWEVFANRGLGYSASQGSVNSRTDQVEAFDLPPTMNPATTFVTECTSYTWPVNGQTYTTSGIYTDTINNSTCVQTVTLDLTILGQIDTGLTQLSDSSVQANHTGSGVTYQWVDCSDNFSLIAGETNAILDGYNGNFAVIINDNGCVDTSDCITLSSAGLTNQTLNGISIYPNPTKDKLIIELDKNYSDITFIVYDLNGKIVQKEEVKSASSHSMNLNLSSGSYILEIKDQSGKHHRSPIQIID